MSPGKLIVIIVAALAAFAAIFLIRGIVSDNERAAQEQAVVSQAPVEIPKSSVLVALRDMRVGETLSESDLGWVEWPEDIVQLNQITKDAQPDALTEFSGTVVRLPIFEQEAFLAQKVVARGETGIMAALLAPGMRAVAIEISEESASGGFILPDDRVDVVLTHEVEIRTANGFEDSIESITVLENVRVLAIDQGISVEAESTTAIGATATLELGPGDVELLALAERSGSLSLSLRSMADAAVFGDVVTSNADALTGGGNTQSGVVTVYKSGRASAGGSNGGE